MIRKKCNLGVHFVAEPKNITFQEPRSTNLTDCYNNPRNFSYECSLKDLCLYDYGEMPLGLVCGNPEHIKEHNRVCNTGNLHPIKNITYNNS